MKKILILSSNKEVQVSDRLFTVMLIYKLFYPPETNLVIGPNKIQIKNYELFYADADMYKDEQVKLFDLPEEEQEINMG